VDSSQNLEESCGHSLPGDRQGSQRPPDRCRDRACGSGRVGGRGSDCLCHSGEVSRMEARILQEGPSIGVCDQGWRERARTSPGAKQGLVLPHSI
jgi:hypothetical protein